MAIIIKTPEQIEGIRKSSQLAAETLKYIEPFVKPLQTETSVGVTVALNITGCPITVPPEPSKSITQLVFTASRIETW